MTTHALGTRLATGFGAGFLATLVFHQGTYLLLYLAGVLPDRPWSLQPVPPFGVPEVLSLSFFGGLWGIALALCLARLGRPLAYWGFALLFGGIAATAVALLVVLPLKGVPLGTLPPAAPFIGFLLNAAWGVGTALFLQTVPATRRRGV